MGLSQLLRRFPRWHAAYRGYREFKQMHRSPIKTPGGFWFSGNKLMQTGAFEPMPRNLEFLMKNVLSNGTEESIEVFPLALSSHSGIAKFFFDAGYQALTANRESRRIPLQEVQQVAATGIDTMQTHNFVFRIAEQE